MFGHKTSLDIFLEDKIIQNIFSNHNGIKLGVDKEKWKIHQYVKIRYTLKESMGQRITKEIRK